MTYSPVAPATAGRRPNGDATTRIVCAVIGALALVVALVVVAATDGSADAGSAQSGGGVANAAPSGGLGADSGSGVSRPSASTPMTTLARLRPVFPFPSGTQPWLERIVQPGMKAYKVSAASISLAAARAFYTRRLPPLGVPIKHWYSDIGGPGGSVRGYGFSYYRETDPKLYVSVDLDRLELPNYLTIVVTLQCQPGTESTAC